MEGNCFAVWPDLFFWNKLFILFYLMDGGRDFSMDWGLTGCFADVFGILRSLDECEAGVEKKVKMSA
jgi:hypothetical protein